MKMPLRPATRWLCLALAFTALANVRGADDWISLFDGKTLAGWKAAEHPDSFKVIDGTIVGNGLRSHLFYLGADGSAEFENFELELDVKAMDGANSGVYFHATWQDEGWPRLSGTEVQVNNDQPVFEKNYIENKKTGSLYGFRNLYKAMARDGEWFTFNIRVAKPRVQVRINGRLMIDYVEPANVPVLVPGATRDILTKGTFALQCHDEKSQIFYRNIRVRRLPPGEDASVTKPVYNDADRARQVLARDNFPLVNLRVHLTDGLTLVQLQELRNRTGIFPGITYHTGRKNPVYDDAWALKVITELKDVPAFAGILIDPEYWLKRINPQIQPMFSPATLAKFDYIVARQRISGMSGEEQESMNDLVSDIVAIMEGTPIDVFANVMVLPKGLASPADVLWTEERMQRVIAAAARNGIALEINPRLRTPSEQFIKLAKAAGVKFTIGSDRNTPEDYTDWSYLLEMQKAAGLTWRNLWVPGHEPTRAQRALLNN